MSLGFPDRGDEGEQLLIPLVATPSSEISGTIGSHRPHQSKLSHMHRTSQITATVLGGAVAGPVPVGATPRAVPAGGVPGNRGWET
jgi:hypothetical protein